MGAFQVLGEVDIPTSQGKTSPNGLQVLDEVDLPASEPPKKYLPEVEKAIKTVPRPDSPLNYAEPGNDVTGAVTGFFPSRTPHNGPRAQLPTIPTTELVKGALNFTPPQSETPLLPGAGSEVSAVQHLATPGKRWQGATEAVQGVGEAATPFMGPAAVEMAAAPALAPALKFATGLGTGIGAQPVAEKVAEKAGAGPEQQKFWGELAFWAPQLAGLISSQVKGGIESTPEGTRASISTPGGKVGAGVAVTPEGVTIRGKVGPLEGSKTFGRGQPTGTGLEPATIEGNAPPPPSDDPAITSMVASRDAEVASAKQAAGIPPPPPPAPPRVVDQANAPAELKKGHIPQKLVDSFETVIEALPENLRSQAIQEAHKTLTQVLIEGSQHGAMVGPDGKLIQVDEGSAPKVALKLINDAISAHDKVSAKALGEAKGRKAGAASTQTAPDIFDSPEVLGEVPLEARTEEGSNGKTQAALPGGSGAPAVGTETQPSVGNKEPAQETGTHKNEATVSAEQPTALKKGDQAVLTKDTAVGEKTLAAGSRVTIQYVHPKGMLVRATAEDGTKFSRGMGAFTKGGSGESKAAQGASAVVPKSETTSSAVTENRPVGSSATQESGKVKLAEPEHPALELGEHAEHTEMLPTQVVAKYRNSHVEMVPTAELEKYKEQDRSAEPRGEKGYLDQLKAELDRDGLKEPLVLKYGSEDKKAHLWDGNHRLNWALAKGVKELPAMVITGKKTDNGYGVSVPGHQGESVPAALKPSEIGLEGRAVKTEGKSEENTTKYKFGNTQAPIHPDSEAAKALESARARISDVDLMGKGKEIGDGGNHVTVRYGIQGEDTAGIKKFLSQQAPFEASLGKTEKFPPSEHSDGAAVIQAPIEAPELHRLNAELEKHGDFTEPSFKEYKPHATVAYVNPEKADRYVGMTVTQGKKFTVDRVAITDRNGNAETVKLEGKAHVEKKPEVVPVTAEGVKPVSQAQTGTREKELESKARVAIAAGNAEKLTPEEKVPEDGKNFEGRYVRASLEPVKAAWLEKWKPRQGEDADEHWKWIVKNVTDATDKPADFSKGHLYIEVPDDGSFYIPNTPSAIDHALKAAGKFDAGKVPHSLPKAGAKKFRMTSPSEGDKQRYVKSLEDELHDAEKRTGAYRVAYAPAERNDEGGYSAAPLPDDQQTFTSEQVREVVAQLKKDLAELKSEQPESILTGESGSLEPGKLGEAASEAAGAVGSYLREAKHATDLARNLQRGLETLDTQKQADILRAAQAMKDLKEQGYSKPDDAAIYHHFENPEGENLTPAQDRWLDDTILPIADRNSDLYSELTDGGIPIENYVHRVVKGKGGMLDRIAQGVKAIGQKATLSKSAPQTKSRTYMALESQDGERQVVSIKGGQVTAWNHGAAENLGGISHTDEGKVFEDKDGKIWNLKQATTKEIEANTGTVYYHSALASTLASNIQLEAAVRAMRFLEAFKASPDFKEISFEIGKGNPPKDWKTTNLPQFKGYAFEPRTAEVLDWYYDRMRQGNIGALEQVGQFMRVAMLLNPIMHPMNVAASWAIEKGATGFLMPQNFKAAWKSGNKAVKAVLSQNQDFLDALDAGAPLQSHREAIKDITKLFFDQLGEGLDKEEPWAMKVAKSLGIEHGNLLNLLHKFSSKVAWTSNDIFFLQSAYEHQAKTPGMSLQDALKETGRIIPEYRVPTRILDSPAISKLMTNRWATIFGSYHYGLLKSFGEVAKSALGAQEPAPGRTKTEEVAKGWDRLAMIALVTMALYPILDELAKKATGDKHARVRRAGPFGLVDAASQVVKHEQSISTAAQRVVTPAPQTKAAAELAFNREFYAGHQIYDPHATFPVQTEQIGRYLLGEMGQIGQVEKAQTTAQKKRFAWGQAGVQFHKSAAEKTASDIAMSKVGTQAEDPEDQNDRVLRREILERLRTGDRKPLQDAQAKHEITAKQVKNLEHRARLTPLQDTIHGFSYSEARKVYEVATPEEKKEIDPIMRQKRTNMFKAGRGREITSATP